MDPYSECLSVTGPTAGPAKRSLNPRTLFASLRLPVRLTRDAEGAWHRHDTQSETSRALRAVLRSRGGVWLGWPGVAMEPGEETGLAFAGAIEGEGVSLRPVWLLREEVEQGAGCFAEGLLLPLLHDLAPTEPVSAKAWAAYQSINRKFAEAIARVAAPSDRLVVYDASLMTVVSELRRMEFGIEAAFFFDVGFPSPDILVRLPWCRSLIEGLLACSRIGFQTDGDLERFLTCVVRLEPRAQVERQEGWSRIRLPEDKGEGREVAAIVCPSGVDYHGLAARAAQPDITTAADDLRRTLGDRKLVVAVDRLRPSQGIPAKLDAFAHSLERFPELCEQVSLLETVIPCGEPLPATVALRSEIERRVGEINGRFGAPGWVPVVYRYAELSEAELLVLYRAADLALMTPLREGMGLAAKEYVAAAGSCRGALVLSEFDGAAARLATAAIVVNPYDLEAMAEAIAQGLALSQEERKKRMRQLLVEVQSRDTRFWAASFLGIPTRDTRRSSATSG
ncbi:MAG TPA: trehalose-6-phosphate synthase [Thermoanaerobaculia bacterium]|nr:trehalose-6-phosphate synthase [Thermoanaerobaculia bacterium]